METRKIRRNNGAKNYMQTTIFLRIEVVLEPG